MPSTIRQKTPWRSGGDCWTTVWPLCSHVYGSVQRGGMSVMCSDLIGQPSALALATNCSAHSPVVKWSGPSTATLRIVSASSADAQRSPTWGRCPSGVKWRLPDSV